MPMKRLVCPACEKRCESDAPSYVVGDNDGQPEFSRFVTGKVGKANAGNESREVIPTHGPCVCDNCNEELPLGSIAIGWTVWLPSTESEPEAWETEEGYLASVDSVTRFTDRRKEEVE